jgi:hypothetical protein
LPWSTWAMIATLRKVMQYGLKKWGARCPGAKKRMAEYSDAGPSVNGCFAIANKAATVRPRKNEDGDAP